MGEIVLDTESDGFKYEATKIWCLCTEDALTGEKLESTWETDLDELLRHIMDQDKVIAHNLLGHDYPLARKLYPWFVLDPDQVEDTFVMSSLFRPDRKAPKGVRSPHSIEAWGKRFGFPKIDWRQVAIDLGLITENSPRGEEFRHWHPDMLKYCRRDTGINVKILHKLREEMGSWDWSQALEIEYGMAEYQGRQELHGVAFDEEAAYGLYEEIHSEIEEVETELLANLPGRMKEGGKPVLEPFTKKGPLVSRAAKWIGEDAEELVWGAFCQVHYVPMNLDSSAQVKTYLLEQGWLPTEWNYKKDARGWTMKDERGEPIPSSPKLTEDSYGTIKGELGQKIARYNVLKHRAGLIFNIRKKDHAFTGWLNIVRPDGRIEAAGVPQGTPTGRYRHSGVVNVPKASDKVLYGKRLRALFTVAPGHTMLGVDAAGLEARMEAHYCADQPGGEEYAYELVDGDVHVKNAVFFGLMSKSEMEKYPQLADNDPEHERLDSLRGDAKSPKYALTYGCTSDKLAATVGCSKRKGKVMYDAFWDGNTALSGFKKTITGMWERRGGKATGFLKGLDGRKLFGRSPHSLVNIMFQSGGSIVVKKATLLLDKWIREEGLRAWPCIHYHDEFQHEVHPDDLERVTELALLAFEEAGRFFNLRVPIIGDAKTGANWAETH